VRPPGVLPLTYGNRKNRRIAQGNTLSFRVVRRDDGSRYYHMCGTEHIVELPRKGAMVGKSLLKYKRLLLAKLRLAS